VHLTFRILKNDWVTAPPLLVLFLDGSRKEFKNLSTLCLEKLMNFKPKISGALLSRSVITLQYPLSTGRENDSEYWEIQI